MHRKKISLLTGLLCFASCMVVAQLSFRFLPEINGNDLNGLFTAELHNLGSNSYEGNISISVKNSQGDLMVQTISPPIPIRPGQNSLQNLAARSQLQFGKAPTALLLSQTGRFPEGEYEYCYEFTGITSKPGAGSQYFDDCFRQSIVPVFPLTLLYPEDGGDICDPRPCFRWQLPVPFSRDYRYQLILVGKKDNQTETEALSENLPIVLINNISSDMLPYPPAVPGLQKGKTYAWQLIAVRGNNPVTKSEIWTFRMECEAPGKDSSINSYRQPGRTIDGNYYLARDTLKFTLINPYGPRELTYSITDLAEPTNKIERLPGLAIKSGINKLDLVLDEVRGLKADKIYLLTIKNGADHFQYLRFIKKERSPD